MELKQTRPATADEIQNYQSYQSGIETIDAMITEPHRVTINRTKVELKRDIKFDLRHGGTCTINRTKVELKPNTEN